MADIKVALELDNKQYIGALKQSEAATDAFSTNASSGMSGVGAAIEGIAAKLGPLVAAFAGLSAALAAINFGDELDDLSRATDVSVGKILQLQSALAMSGGAAEDAGTMIAKLQREIQAARSGSAEAQNSLDKLGFTLSDMANLTPEQGIQKTIEALAAIPDATERNALAFQLLGRAAASIDWEGVAAGIQGSTEKYDKFTYATELAAQVNDILAGTYKTLKLALLEALVPVMELITQFQKFPGLAKLAGGAVTLIAEAFKAITLLASDVAFVIDRIVSGVLALAEAGAQVAQGNIGNAKAIIQAYNAESAKMRSELDKFQTGISSAAAQQQKIEEAAKKAEDRRRANQGDATKPAVELANKNQIETIKGMADTYALLNEKARAKIALDYQMIGATQEAVKSENERVRIQQAAADAIDKLNTQRNALKNTLTDRNAIAAIDATIEKIKKQAQIDTEATLTIIRNQEEIIRARERAAASFTSFGRTSQDVATTFARARVEMSGTMADRIAAETRINAVIEYRNRLLEGAAKQGLKPDELEALRLTIVKATHESNYLNTNLKDIASTINDDLNRANKIPAPFGNPVPQSVIDSVIKYGSAVGDAIEYNTNVAINAKQRIAEELLQYQQRIEFEKRFRQAKIDVLDVENQIADLTLSETDKRLLSIDRLIAKETQLAIVRLQEARGPQGTVSEQERANIAEKITGIYESQRQANERLIKQSRDFSTGWKKAMSDYIDAAGNAANRASNLFKKATQGMEDAIINFVKTGKFEWKNFVNMMVEELLRAQIQQLMANMIGGIQGAANQGGLLGGGLSMIGGLLGLGGGAGGKGQTSNNPLYVMDVSGRGQGGFPSLLGGGQSQGGGIINGIKNAVGGIIDTIGNIGSSIGSVISGGGIGGGQGGGFMTGISNAIGGIVDTVGSIGSSIGNIFSSGSSGGGFLDSLSSIGSSIMDTGSSILGGIGDFFSGFFANGGNIPAGKFGIVGERGPEFISGPASITPMSGATQVTYNINAVDAASFQALIARDPAFIHAVAEQGRRTQPMTRR